MPITKEVREIDDQWQLATVSNLIGGMNADFTPHLVEDEQSPDLLNVAPNAKSLLAIDSGYAQIAQAVVGTPRRVFDHVKSDGTVIYVLVTNSTVYRWVSAVQEWQLVSNGTSTTVTTQAVATDTSIEVASSTGFTPGELIGLVMDNGKQHQTTIASVPDGTHVVLTDAVPAGRTINISAVVVEGVGLSGTADHYCDGVNVPFDDTLVFTNNVDQPQKWNGTTCVPVPNLPSAPNFAARTVAVFSNYLLFGWCTEGGVEKPWRIRRCDTADATNWSTGNAGFDDLLDGEDGIVRLQNLATRCVAYREASISVGLAVNTDETVFEWITPIRGDGAVSTGAVADVGDHHIVVGGTTVYRYKGGLDMEPILSPMQSFLYGASGDISPLYIGRTFAFYLLEHNEIWIAYPTVGNDYPNRILRYDLDTEGWFVRDLTDHVSGIGVNKKDLDRAWNGLIGTWVEQNWNWNSKQLVSTAPTIMLCGADTNVVYEYDYLAADDDGTSIPYHVETKDFISLHKKIRFDYLLFFVRGTSITTEYSVDGGQSWVVLGVVSPGSTLSVQRLTRQVVSYQIRFRWSGSGGGFALGWFGFAFREESEV
jgi:hypothetical protein